jgi:predicted extracellular nuclease
MRFKFYSFFYLILILPTCSLAQFRVCGDFQSPLFQYISRIQGKGFTSPYVGKRLITEGLVTQVSLTGYSGFWLQQTGTDPNVKQPASQGIFVYHDKKDVKPGDRVRLLGRVAEYHGLTEITAVEQIAICSQGQGVPAIIPLTLPLTSLVELEALEGMRVQLKQGLVVSDLFGAGYGLGNYGQFAVSSRLYFHPSELFSRSALIRDPSLLQQKELDYLLIDDGLAAAYPAKIPFPSSQGFSTSKPLRVGDQLLEVTGVLHAYGEHYLVIPDFHQPFSLIPSIRTEAPKLDPRANVRIVSFNLGNYFNGDKKLTGQQTSNGFPTARGARSYSGFKLQRQKLVNALTKMDADIIALMELENDGYGPNSAIADLTHALNQSLNHEETYEYIDPQLPRLGDDVISVGFLYRKNTIKLTSQAKVIRYRLHQNDHLTENKRPSLAQVFSAQGKDFLVVVNHFKSKGRPCLSDRLSEGLQDQSKIFLSGHCNQERLLASQQLIDFIKGNYSTSLPSLLLGDFNSYSQEQPLLRLYQAGFKNLKKPGQFSYSYQGYLANLDHGLANEGLLPYVLNSHSWNINSLEDVLLDYQTEENGHPYPAIDSYGQPDVFRSSDHDPIIIELKF